MDSPLSIPWSKQAKDKETRLHARGGLAMEPGTQKMTLIGVSSRSSTARARRHGNVESVQDPELRPPPEHLADFGISTKET